MSRPATDQLKVNPPLGMMPSLQYLPPAMLEIDPSYQRSLDSDTSRTLVRGIAQHWNWDLCQPLVVARRDGGALFVIDGQHGLAAARLRGDIAQLPAVVVQYSSAADEAASFVQLNQQQRALTKIDLFKASVASGDTEAVAILNAVHAAGLTIAPHTNTTAWKPGMIAHIGGLEACLRGQGDVVLRLALRALADGFSGQVMQYAGTLFPGIAAVMAIEVADGGPNIEQIVWDTLIEMIGAATQEQWRRDIMQVRADDPGLNFGRASKRVFTDAWAEVLDGLFGPKLAPAVKPDVGKHAIPEANCVEATPPVVMAARIILPEQIAPVFKVHPLKPTPEPDLGKKPVIQWGRVAKAARGKPRLDDEGKAWCTQCDQRRTLAQIKACTSKFCTFGAKA